MQEIILENGFVIKRLSESDRAEVSVLCIRCEDYYQLHCGILPAEKEVDEIFRDLPPGKDYDDKFVLGVYDSSNNLSGVLDIIRNYVVEGEWTIGLMLLEPAVRGSGLGKMIHNALKEWAKGLDANTFRIGVIEENMNGQAFWAAMEYKKVKDVSMTFEEKTHTVNVMTLTFSDNIL